MWKYRAEQARIEPYPTIPGMMPLNGEVAEEGGEEELEEEVDETREGGEAKKQAIRDHATPEIPV